MAKRASLSDFAATKPQPEPAEASSLVAAVSSPKAAERRGQTLRLTPAAWSQLKHLAVDRGVPAHDLLREAVNDLFQKHGKPPIA